MADSGSKGTEGSLGLTAQDIDLWSGRLSAGYGRLWADLRHLATKVASSPDDGYAWNHFVLAVGNYKRQTEIYAFLPKGVAKAEAEPLPDVVKAVGRDGDWFDLGRDDEASWQELDHINGVGVPTATTILAALWPDHHAILDVRAMRVSLALAGASDDWQVEPEATKSPEITWQRYSWYRKQVLATSAKTGKSVLQIERTLFMLDYTVPPHPTRSWRNLSTEVLAALHAGR